MKRVATILLVLSVPVVVAGLILVPGQIRAKRSAARVVTISSLKVAYADLEQEGRFSNRWPQFCRISSYTNRYAISGTVYQCVLAADSWDYRGRDNLLAITANGSLLFIDKKGALALNKWNDLPGY